MKKTLFSFLVILITIILGGCGKQPAPKSELVYTRIIQHDKKANDAFEFGKMWLANTFVDSKAVIEYANKEKSTIIGKGIVPKIKYAFLVYGDTKFTITIQNKDNRSKITMKNMEITTWDTINGKLQYDLWNIDQFKKFSVEADKLVVNFQKAIKSGEGDSNW